jgi:hypothetical protein
MHGVHYRPKGVESISEGAKLTDLPVELLSHIISYIVHDPLKCVADYASVSQNFLRLCLHHSQRLRWHFTFSPRRAAKTFLSGQLDFTFSFPLDKKFLLQDSQGRQYHYCQMKDLASVLIIFTPEFKNGNKFFFFDLAQVHTEKRSSWWVKILKDTSHTLSFARPPRILSCLEYSEGFVIVAETGISIWKYHDDFPTFEQFISFSESLNGERPFTESAIINNILILKKEIFFVYAFDLTVPSPTLCHVTLNSTLSKIISSNTRGDLHIKGTHNNLFLVERLPNPYHDEVRYHQLTLSRVSDSDFELNLHPRADNLKLTAKIFPNVLPHVSSRWFLHFAIDSGEPLIYVIDGQTGRLCIGQQHGLIPPNPSLNESWFIRENFLFLSYIMSKIKVIHLPTGKEYTQVFSRYLAPYLEHSASIYSVSTRRNLESIFEIDVLLLIEEVKENETVRHFREVKIYFDDKLEC